MKNCNKISDLFEEKPCQWGLRGDPYLWNEMIQFIGEFKIPDTEEQLISLIESTFEQLTGSELSSTNDIHIERYSHGGMSSGYVCLEFWREKALPMFRERYIRCITNRTK